MPISSRRWIRWVPDTPTEPTDTLVLTSPKGHYVDVRTILGIDEVATAATEKTLDELLNISADRHNGPPPADDLRPHQAAGRDELAVSWDRLDWAFAGKSESRQEDEGRHSTWHHWVDSRTADAVGTSDSGVMSPYEGENTTGETLELEKGKMLNPLTGKEQEYEEVWADIPQEPAGKETGNICVVLVAQNKSKETPTGVVVRIGQYCQGVLRVGSKFVVERWQWSKKDGVWKRSVRIGSGQLPCPVACTPGPEVKMGMEFRPAEGGLHWRVAEMTRD